MNSKTNEIAVLDSNAMVNTLMNDIIDIDRMESFVSSELTSEELYRIDSAILGYLKNVSDFSENLLQNLENGGFEIINQIPEKQDELALIQKVAMVDITQPLQNLFDEMSSFIIDDLKG